MLNLRCLFFSFIPLIFIQQLFSQKKYSIIQNKKRDLQQLFLIILTNKKQFTKETNNNNKMMNQGENQFGNVLGSIENQMSGKSGNWPFRKYASHVGNANIYINPRTHNQHPQQQQQQQQRNVNISKQPSQMPAKSTFQQARSFPAESNSRLNPAIKVYNYAIQHLFYNQLLIINIRHLYRIFKRS